MAKWNSTKLLNRARSIPWDKNNKFFVVFDGGGSKTKKTFNSLIQDPHSFNVYIESITIQDLSTDPIEKYINEKYVSTTGRINCTDLEFKFRDFNHNTLYKMFRNFVVENKRSYPEDIYFNFKFLNEPSWGDKQGATLCVAKNCILHRLGGLSFDNGSQNQITTFNATFKCPIIDFKV